MKLKYLIYERTTVGGSYFTAHRKYLFWCSADYIHDNGSKYWSLACKYGTLEAAMGACLKNMQKEIDNDKWKRAQGKKIVKEITIICKDGKAVIEAQ